MRKHFEVQHSELVEKIVCPSCQQLVSNPSNLRIHCKRLHRDKMLKKKADEKARMDEIVMNAKWVEVPKSDLKNGRYVGSFRSNETADSDESVASDGQNGPSVDHASNRGMGSAMANSPEMVIVDDDASTQSFLTMSPAVEISESSEISLFVPSATPKISNWKGNESDIPQIPLFQTGNVTPCNSHYYSDTSIELQNAQPEVVLDDFMTMAVSAESNDEFHDQLDNGVDKTSQLLQPTESSRSIPSDPADLSDRSISISSGTNGSDDREASSERNDHDNGSVDIPFKIDNIFLQKLIDKNARTWIPICRREKKRRKYQSKSSS